MNKNLTVILIGLGLFIFCKPVSAGGPLSLGVLFGDPTGAVFKYGLKKNTYLEGNLGGRAGGLSIIVEWMNYWEDLTPVGSGKFEIGLGGGGLLGFGDQVDLGIRGKVALNYQFPDVPLEIFIEISPAIIITDFDSDVMGGLGVRWIFN